MAYGTVNADLMTTSDGISSSGLYGFKNRLINSAMMIDQRNAGASVTANDSVFPVDRFSIRTSLSSKGTAQQSTTVPAGFKNSLLFTSSAATSLGASDYMTITQFIEGFNVADLGWGTANAQTVTLSFWVRSSLTGTFGGSLNNTSSRSYPFTYTISSANTFEYKTITIAGDTSGTWPTDNTSCIRLWLGLGVGSTYSGTAGAWAGAAYLSATGATSVVGTNGATFYITGVQLEKGSTATSFDYRPYPTELALAQRYFFAWNAQGSSTAVAPSTNEVDLTCWFPVTMRAIPTITNNATAGSGSGVTGINPYIGSALSTRAGVTLASNGPSTQHANFYSTAFTVTAGQAGNWNFNSGVYLYMSAEL
jgi:hypothetical protein